TVRHTASIVVPGPDVVQVALIEPSASPVVAAPPPLPTKPAEKMPEVKPTEAQGVKIEKEKPPPKKMRQPPPDVAPPARAPAPTLPSEAIGNAGLRGQVAVDARDFEFTYYLVLVRNRIAQN